MKYSENNIPYVCMQTQSTCYKSTKVQKPVGILWHSTGSNNPNLKRYVQPSDNSATKQQDLAKLGVNANHNDWNHISRNAGLNAWIGKFADGSIGTVQSMPWDYRPWGCGSGNKGSCNNGWIQFEICEDGLNDKVYFEAVYKEACELTAYLCKMYNINPTGTVSMNGISVPTITCHNDAAKLGLAVNHSDINHWFPKFGKNMATVRTDVAAILNSGSSTPTPQPKPSTGNPYKEPTTTIKKGSKGEGAKWVQYELIEAGYGKQFSYNGKNYNAVTVDGEIGTIGDAAIRSFQTVSKITVDGMIGPTGRATLKNNKSDIAPKPINESVQPTPAPVVSKNPYKEPTVTIKKGSKGEGVKWMQWELIEAGYGKKFQYNTVKYNAVTIDGQAGDITDAAIRAFQKRKKLTVDGLAGKATREALKANHGED